MSSRLDFTQFEDSRKLTMSNRSIVNALAEVVLCVYVYVVHLHAYVLVILQLWICVGCVCMCKCVYT